MLDRWFINSLNNRGILWYWVGQLSVLGLLALVIFAGMGMSMDEGIGYMVGYGLVFILVWGFSCKAIWPEDGKEA